MESQSNRLADDWESKVFQSSHIHSGVYSPSRRTMLVRFGGGSGTRGLREFSYQVPPDLWAQFKGAQSPGKFMRETIAPNFIANETQKEMEKEDSK